MSDDADGVVELYIAALLFAGLPWLLFQVLVFMAGYGGGL